MATWTSDELDSLDSAYEIRVAGSRKDGSLRSFRVIWHVVVDGGLYARSVNGPDADWYVGVQRQLTGAVQWGGNQRDVDYINDSSHDDAVDEAFRRKYGNGSPTQSLNRHPARGTTLRIEAK